MSPFNGEIEDILKDELKSIRRNRIATNITVAITVVQLAVIALAVIFT